MALIDEVYEIDPRPDTVSWETSLLESPDMMEGYIIIHHVRRSMSAQKRNRYRRSVEKGIHMEDGNKHTSGHKQALAENDLDMDIRNANNSDSRAEIDNQLRL